MICLFHCEIFSFFQTNPNQHRSKMSTVRQSSSHPIINHNNNNNGDGKDKNMLSLPVINVDSLKGKICEILNLSPISINENNNTFSLNSIFQ
jgi:hypothetical protein